MYEKYPGEAELKTIRSHMFKFLHTGLQKHTDIRDVLNQSKGYEPLKQVALMMQERRKDETKEDKIGWYYRHWKGMDIDRDQIQTYSLEEWDDQCEKDPLMQKFLQSEPYKRFKKDNQGAEKVLTDKTVGIADGLADGNGEEVKRDDDDQVRDQEANSGAAGL